MFLGRKGFCFFFILIPQQHRKLTHRGVVVGGSLKLYWRQVRTPLLGAAGPGPGTRSFPRLAQHDFLMPFNSFTDPPESGSAELSREVTLYFGASLSVRKIGTQQDTICQVRLG